MSYRDDGHTHGEPGKGFAVDDSECPVCSAEEEEERGVCMNCGADMDYSPMHPWCPDCSEDDDDE